MLHAILFVTVTGGHVTIAHIACQDSLLFVSQVMSLFAIHNSIKTICVLRTGALSCGSPIIISIDLGEVGHFLSVDTGHNLSELLYLLAEENTVFLIGSFSLSNFEVFLEGFMCNFLLFQSRRTSSRRSEEIEA